MSNTLIFVHKLRQVTNDPVMTQLLYCIILYYSWY